jgi:hypothetical protein
VCGISAWACPSALPRAGADYPLSCPAAPHEELHLSGRQDNAFPHRLTCLYGDKYGSDSFVSVEWLDPNETPAAATPGCARGGSPTRLVSSNHWAYATWRNYDDSLIPAHQDMRATASELLAKVESSGLVRPCGDTSGESADTKPPVVKALPSRGVRGHRAKLFYRVRDDSGVAREVITVRAGGAVGGKVILTRRTSIGPRNGAKVYYVEFTIPRRLDYADFCVRAFDKVGNRSALSCARLRIL